MSDISLFCWEAAFRLRDSAQSLEWSSSHWKEPVEEVWASHNDPGPFLLEDFWTCLTHVWLIRRRRDHTVYISSGLVMTQEPPGGAGNVAGERNEPAASVTWSWKKMDGWNQWTNPTEALLTVSECFTPTDPYSVFWMNKTWSVCYHIIQDWKRLFG